MHIRKLNIPAIHSMALATAPTCRNMHFVLLYNSIRVVRR